MGILLGAIADDFTGACDLAGLLAQAGMGTHLLIGVPEGTPHRLLESDAVVIALKTRTAPVAEALRLSIAALDWLLGQGVEQVFFKICSTFDSTAQGNIGPVAEALGARLGARVQLVCPAYPANGRTVYQGHLFVGGTLLSESPMRHHPLTPMDDANLIRVLQAQTRATVASIPWPVVAQGTKAVQTRLAELSAQGVGMAIADALTDQDLAALGAAAVDLPLLTGSAGLALGLPANFARAGRLADRPSSATLPLGSGPAAVLAGSCSAATRAQVAYLAQRVPAVAIDPLAAEDPRQLAALALEALAEPLQRGEPILIYSSIEPAAVARVQSRLGQHQAANLIESSFAELACQLVRRGVRRLVVAGGETAGAVVTALGVHALAVGPQIDPGVPWTQVLDGPPLLLALKSGNFGSREFFAKALEMRA